MHNISDFADIGKALLIQALGIQGNYKQVVEDGIDREASGCLTCPYYAQHDESMCCECSARKMFTKEVYVNERNRYGRLPVLSLNPLKMLILLHFMKPNKDGVVRVSLMELAKSLCISYRTVFNNMDTLCQYGYISCSSTLYGKRSILIHNYNEAFKNASEGGRGYIVAPASLCECVLAMKDVNDIRITMRAYLDVDNNNTKQGGAFFNVIRKSFKQIMHELPRTISKGNVLNLLRANPVFSFSNEEGMARLVIRDKFVGKKLLNNGLKEVTEKVRTLIGEFNTFVDFSNYFRTSDRTPEMSVAKEYVYGDDVLRNKYNDIYKPLFEGCEPIERGVLFRYMTLDEGEILNTARLSMYYGYDVVVRSLRYIYASYINAGEHIKNFGGLLRSVISKIKCESELIVLQ